MMSHPYAVKMIEPPHSSLMFNMYSNQNNIEPRPLANPNLNQNQIQAQPKFPTDEEIRRKMSMSGSAYDSMIPRPSCDATRHQHHHHHRDSSASNMSISSNQTGALGGQILQENNEVIRNENGKRLRNVIELDLEEDDLEEGQRKSKVQRTDQTVSSSKQKEEEEEEDPVEVQRKSFDQVSNPNSTLKQESEEESKPKGPVIIDIAEQEDLEELERIEKEKEKEIKRETFLKALEAVRDTHSDLIGFLDRLDLQALLG